MIIFIDFDDVLFNTKRFKDDIIGLFLRNGITKEIFDKYYHNPKQDKVLKTYDPWRQLEMIRAGEGIDTGKMKKELEAFMDDTADYLFEDSLDFMETFNAENIRIVSYGEEIFQARKIAGCGAGSRCDRVSVTEELKSEVIGKILKEGNFKDEKIFFIEDRIEQIEDVKSKFPFVKTIFIRRPEGRYHDEPTQYCDFEASNLKEAEKIIRK
ncbi:MAG: hypothetical protein ACD_11C00014G0002 [uncultured bacterium]|nr:MAG: hypothetical protein ACD_11C00014G0002 [uncultured bacterium]